MSKTKENNWSNYILKGFVNTVSHPFQYAKVLIQIGYEPIPPRPAKTLFGKPALKLPNIFQYVKHIKSVDGYSGCYAGLGPKLAGNFLSGIVAQKLAEYMKLPLEDEDSEEESSEITERQKFLTRVKGELITHTAAIIVSQPFHVITVRIMAQFVGRETAYNGFISSVKEIYQQNGALGFFSGLVPRLLGDILTLVVASSLTYVINRYLIEEKELKCYTSSTVTFLVSAVTYPFEVVSNCMAVTNSGLIAGSPRQMPHYGSWLECWSDLSNRNQLKRGSSVLVRYYVGPSILIGGKNVPFPKDIKAIS